MNSTNVEILSQLGFLRCLSDAFKGGDQSRYFLGLSIDSFIGTISNLHGTLYSITSYRQFRRKYYANGLGYKYIKHFKITID